MTCILWRLATLGLAFAGLASSLPRDGLDAHAVRHPYDEAVRNYGRAASSTSVLLIFGSIDPSGNTVIISTAVPATSAVSASATSTPPSSSASPTSSRSAASSSASASASASPASTASSGTLPTATPSSAASSNQQSNDGGSGGGGLSGGAIAGIVVGVVAALAIAAALGFLLAKRRKANNRDASTNNPNRPNQEPNFYSPPAPKQPSNGAPYAGPSDSSNVYTSVTAGYQPQPLASHSTQHPVMSELPAESSRPAQPAQPPQPWATSNPAPDSPHGRVEVE